MISRRTLISRLGTAALAAGSLNSLSLAARAAAAASPEPGRGPEGFVLGVAGYTFVKFSLDQTLEMLRKVDAHYLCIKDFHLPLTATDADIAAFHEKCAKAGVTGYGVGPIYMSSEEEVLRAFDYARRVGVRTVVGVPFRQVDKRRVASPELLKVVEAQVREHDMRYAIHNHGPDMPELFPNAESIMRVVGRLDPRVGLCLDIGHEFRDGKDPIRSIREYHARIHDLHLKNVTAPDKSGRGIELPRGAISIPALVRTLRKVGYRGVCSLEYEKDMENPINGIAESIGYFRGVLDAARSRG